MRFHNEIYFLNRQSKLPVTADMKKLIRRAVSETLKREDFPHPAEVSVTFTDNEGIRELNRGYRGKDAPTDVLSFPILSEDDSDWDIDEANGCAVLGDIVISVERAMEQAEIYGHSPEREIAFLSVHSTLHLLGYDHERSEEEDKLMREKQEKILSSIGQERKSAK